MPISEIEILLRLLLAAGLGALIGFERETHGQAAGLRTHMILAVGATLAMTLSINLAAGSGGDPARLAAQVVSGIGFLGAGAILRYGASIRGLTTATSLWTLAIVGLAVGTGEYLVGAATAVFLLIILSLLDLVEKFVVRARVQIPLMISGKDGLLRIDDLRALLRNHKIDMFNLFISKNIKKQTVTLRVMITYSSKQPVQPLLDDLSALPGMHTFQLGEPAQQS